MMVTNNALDLKDERAFKEEECVKCVKDLLRENFAVAFLCVCS